MIHLELCCNAGLGIDPVDDDMDVGMRLVVMADEQRFMALKPERFQRLLRRIDHLFLRRLFAGSP